MSKGIERKSFHGPVLHPDDKDDPDNDTLNQCSKCLNCCITLKVMSCLHVLCIDCLTPLLSGETGVIICPLCTQKTVTCKPGLCDIPKHPISIHTPVEDASCTHNEFELCEACLGCPFDWSSHIIRYQVEELRCKLFNLYPTLVDNSKKFEKLLNELDFQNESAQKAIMQVHDSCVALLENMREKSLDELQALYRSQHSAIMEPYQHLNQTREKVKVALGYTTSVLKIPAVQNDLQQLSVLKAVQTQLQVLCNISKQNERVEEPDTVIQFEGNVSRFEEALKGSYGEFIQFGKVLEEKCGVVSASLNEADTCEVRSMKCTVLLARNVPHNLDDGELEKACEVYGPVKFVNKKRNRAFIHFENPEDASQALLRGIIVKDVFLNLTENLPAALKRKRHDPPLKFVYPEGAAKRSCHTALVQQELPSARDRATGGSEGPSTSGYTPSQEMDVKLDDSL